jgi:hypothetical protein
MLMELVVMLTHKQPLNEKTTTNAMNQVFISNYKLRMFMNETLHTLL